MNNFDFLRLLFAAVVCVVHAEQLSGLAELKNITAYLSSAVAVKAFFVVSGYLIFMSYDRSASLWDYANKRIRRIYPAYVAIVMLCAVGLVTVSNAEAAVYFSDAWLKYVVVNLGFLNFLQPDLPGVFEANKLHAVNGALWTLKIEVMFYLSVPLLAFVFNRLGRRACLVSFYLVSVAYAWMCSNFAAQSGSMLYVELGRQLPGQLAYFLSGAFYYFFASQMKPYMTRLMLSSVALLVINLYVALPVFEPFALATVVVFAATYRRWGNFGKYGDFSYGFYILHFPLIQLMIQQGWLVESPWLFLLVALLLTGAGAVAMWHLVEKRFLSRTSHYVFASTFNK
jgi:peptidoglycan/LPS O-acetylase OafA/YrhL